MPFKVNMRSGVAAGGDWINLLRTDTTAVTLDAGWSINYVSGAVPASDGSSLGGWPLAGDAALWIDDENAATSGHRVPASPTWVQLQVNGPASSSFDLEVYSHGPSGRFVEWRLNGGTSQNIDESTNSVTGKFSGTTDGSGVALIEYREGSGSSGTGYANAILITPGAAADTTPPTFSSAPAVTATTDSGHSISTTINEAGTVYGVRLANGATAPSAAQVKAGQDSTGSAALEVKSAAASNSATLTFSTGSASTAYDYYILAEDDEGTPNLQATPTLVEATTAAAQVPGITGFSLYVDGVLEGNLTGIEVVVLAGTTLDGTKVLYSATETAPSGVLNDIDLSATSIGVGDSYTMTVRVPDGENLTVTSTASNIA